MSSRKAGSIGVVLAIASFMAALWLSGCSPAAAAQEVSLTEPDAGKSLELRPGERLSVTLEGNPSTGYSWERVSGDVAVLKQVGEPEITPAGDRLGAPALVTLRFEAVAAGQTHLQLVYHRPWEKDVPAAKTWSVAVVVK